MTLHYSQDGQASLPSVWVKEVPTYPGPLPYSRPPDSVGCCVASNVTHPRCVEMSCDHATLLSVCPSNMVTCAHWADPMFSCLTDTRHKRLCCGAQGLPDTCQDQSLRIFSPLFSLMRCYQICITIVEGVNVLCYC